jgi:hypothetical protein
MISKNRGL